MYKIFNIIMSIVFTCIMFITGPIYSGCGALFFFLSYEKRYAILSQWPRAMVRLARCLCGIKWHVRGLENLPETPCIIISNHQSTWETFAFFEIFPYATFVLKKELLSIPFFGWGLRQVEPIAIARKEARLAMEELVQQGKKRLLAQRSIIIFPEGRRMPEGQLGTFKSGGAFLAIKAQAPLLPVAIRYAGRCWPRRAWKKYAGTIEVLVGKPIYPKEKETAALLTSRVRDAVLELLNQE